jgi:hypothetical protein
VHERQREHDERPERPASVGVAQPKYIAEKMISTTAMIGNVPGTDCQRWVQLKPRIGRPRLGFMRAISTISPQ